LSAQQDQPDGTDQPAARRGRDSRATGLRTLDAIHLAAAQTAPELRALVAYDTRLADAAESLGIAVASPR